MTPDTQDQPTFAESKHFGPLGQFAGRFTHQAALGTLPDRTLDSDYLRNVVGPCPQLAAGSIIDVICEGPAYYEELLVRSVNRMAHLVDVVRLRLVELPDANVGALDDGLPANHSVRYLGPASKWSVLRGSQAIKDNFENRAEALAFAKDLGRVRVA